MAIPGNWKLHYDWDSDGSYSTESITFNNDGTWSSSEGATGRWVHIEGMFIFNFDASTPRTIYAGLVASGSVTGNMTTFAGLNGSWYMLKEGASLKVKEGASTKKTAGAGRDLSGQQRKAAADGA